MLHGTRAVGFAWQRSARARNRTHAASLLARFDAMPRALTPYTCAALTSSLRTSGSSVHVVGRKQVDAYSNPDTVVHAATGGATLGATGGLNVQATWRWSGASLVLRRRSDMCFGMLPASSRLYLLSIHNFVPFG